MYITLKDAVLISILIHSAAFLPLHGKNVPAPVLHKKESIMVDYIKFKEPERKAIDTQKIEVVPKVEMKAADSSPAVKAPVQSPKYAADALAAKQAKIMSTRDYVNYYQLIREKIRQKLKGRYRTYYGEGDTGLIFVLRSDGKLISVAVDKSAPLCNQMLISTALRRML